MKISNLKKLKKFEKVYLVKDIKKLSKLEKNFAYIIINHDNIKNFDLIKNEKNIFFFSWQYFKRGYLTTLSDKLAYKNIDNEFKIFKNKNKIVINLFIKIYGSEKILIAVKKKLLYFLKEYYDTIVIHRIIKFFYKKKIINLEHNKLRDISFGLFLENKTKNTKSFIVNLLKFFVFPIYLVFNNRVSIFQKKKNYLDGFRIYKGGIEIKSEGGVNWLLDKNDQNNSLFILEDYYKHDSTLIKNLKKEGYNYINCNNKKQSGKITISSLIKNLFIYFPISFLLSIYIFIFNKKLLLIFYNLWTSYFKWVNILEYINIKRYIVYHNYQDHHICRNIILKKNNVTTIHYKHTSSENIFNYRVKNYNSIQANIFYDIEYHQTLQSIEMSNLNKSLSEKKIIVGPTMMIKKDHNFIPKKKIIFFNTTFTDGHAANPVESHFIFLNFIKNLKLCDNLNYQEIVLKSKKKISLYKNYNNKFKSLIENLEKLNVRFIDEPVDNSKLILESDISIHMPFSSTAVISLAFKKKFFFFDGLNYFKRSYYNKSKNIKIISSSNKNNYELLNFYNSLKQNEYEKLIRDFHELTFGKDFVFEKHNLCRRLIDDR